MIQAKLLQHSKHVSTGDNVYTFELTFPTIILKELNTHRERSANTSSARAIPFAKMLESVKNNPFIPIAYQKAHSGMQGTDYLDKRKRYEISDFLDSLKANKPETAKQIRALLSRDIVSKYGGVAKTLDDWWLHFRDLAVESATVATLLGMTKQLANRLLEPFMWTRMIFTISEPGLQNLFNQRCPNYETFYSWKSFIKHTGKKDVENFQKRQSYNNSQAEIHFQMLAEQMYDAINDDHEIVLLNEGEWHIPNANQIKAKYGDDLQFDELIKLSTVYYARTSYTLFEEQVALDKERMLEIYDQLMNSEPIHWSPFEHNMKAMNSNEYQSFRRGHINDEQANGWCFNNRGFMNHRYILIQDLSEPKL